MTILNKDNVADYENPDARINASVSAEQRQAFGNIGKQVGFSRLKVLQMFNEESRDFRRAKGAASRAAKQNPEAFKKGEAKAAGLRLAVDETKLRKATETYPNRMSDTGQGRDALGTTMMNVTVEIDPTCLFRENRLTSFEAFRDYMRQVDHNWSTPHNGIGVTGTAFHSFNPDQADAIATKLWTSLESYKNLHKVFSGNGVSEANVQVALQFAKEKPEEAIALLGQNSTEISEEIEKTKAKRDVVAALEDLSRIEPKNYDKAYDYVLREMPRIQNDLTTLSLPSSPTAVPPQSEMAKKLTHNTMDLFGISVTDKRKVIDKLNAEFERLQPIGDYYQRMKTSLQRIYNQAKRAGIINHLGICIDPTTETVIDSNLGAWIDPKVDADKYRAEFKFDTLENLVKKIQELEKQKKDIEDGKNAKTGREAVLAMYQKHFERDRGAEKGLPPDQARRAAEELYGKNALGRQEEVLQRKLIYQSREVLPDKPLGWLAEEGRAIKGLALGAEEDFVSNLAESDPIGLSTASDRRSTRSAWLLWQKRKWGAHPQWAKLEYPQLLTAFYAIRDSQRKKHLSNSSYVRRQLDEVRRLLTQRFTTDMIKTFDSANIPEEERKELEALSENARRQKEIRLLLSDEARPPYQSDVEAAISYAVGATARKRRAVGRAAKKATVATGKAALWTAKRPYHWARGEGKWFNPLTWPGRFAKGTYKAVAPRAKGFWNHLMAVEEPIFS